MATNNQILVAVDACIAMMGGGFCLQSLQQNDPNYDWSFESVETLAEKVGITGLYVLNGVLATVYYQADMSDVETCLVIAHEIGHHFLHRNLQVAMRQMAELGMVDDIAGRKILADSRREWEAETFGELLLERCGIRRPAAESNA